MTPPELPLDVSRALGQSIACIGYVARDLCAPSPLSAAAWEQVRLDAALAIERFADAVAAVTGEAAPPSSDTEIAELERLSDAATPGPWCEHPNGTSIWSGAEYDNDDVSQRMLLAVLVDRIQADAKGAYDDVTLVVALRNAAPRLIADARIFRSDARARAASRSMMREQRLATLVACDEDGTPGTEPLGSVLEKIYIEAGMPRSLSIPEMPAWTQRLAVLDERGGEVADFPYERRRTMEWLVALHNARLIATGRARKKQDEK